MLTAREVLTHLATDPTERRLFPLLERHAVRATTLLGSLDLGAAVTVIPVDEGLLVLPVDQIDANSGWEQYDLDAAEVLTPPTAWTARAATLRHLQTALIAQLIAAPRVPDALSDPSIEV